MLKKKKCLCCWRST